MPPSLSFVHDLRMNTVLPQVLHPYLASMQLEDMVNVDVTDLGLKLNVHGSTSTQQLQIRGGLVVGTFFVEQGARLLSNITYAGVVDGSGDEKSAGGSLDKLLQEARAGQLKKANSMVSAQCVSSNATVLTEAETSSVFVALWLACMLAVEATLLVLCAMAFVVRVTVMWFCEAHKPRSEVTGVMQGIESARKQGLLPLSALVLCWIVAGALGSALAVGILVAFWQRA